MGIVVEVLLASDKSERDATSRTNDNNQDVTRPGASAGDAHIVLDDGTGVLVSLTTPIHMIRKAPVEVGRTVECIAVLDQAGQRGLVVDQLFVICDVHAEVLRWAQLAYHRAHPHQPQISHPSRPFSLSNRPWHAKGMPRAVGCGYPPDTFTVDDLHDVICSEGQDDAEEDCPQTKGSNLAQPKPPPNRLPLAPPRGFTAHELSLILNVEPTRMASMIEELQMSARVYKDESGRFLPL